MEALLTLGRPVRMSRGMEVGWMFPSTYVAVSVVCTLGGVVSKGQTVVPLSVRSKGEIFWNFKLSAKEGQVKGDGLGC